MFISLDAEKASDKTQLAFMLKVLERSGIPAGYLTIIKTLYSKSKANIKLKEEKLKSVPLNLGTR